MKHLFENLPQQFRFIAVDADGTASAYTEVPRWDGAAWIPTSQTGAVKALGTGKPGEFDFAKDGRKMHSRDADELPQLSQDITARQHYAFELVKIALADRPMMTRDEIHGLMERAYVLADRFLDVGAK